MAGALCISIDLELAWGVWDRPSADHFDRCAERERHIVERLLSMFSATGIPATWAVVGRLLEKGPVPVESRHGDAIWYAPDLIDAIRAAAPRHDLGSHTYAHLYFHEQGEAPVEQDLAEARRVHREHGLDFTSFVFPRNQVGHIDVLRRAGVKVFRSVDVGWHTAVRRRLGRLPGRLANLVDKVVPVPPTAVHPTVHEGGVVELPSSMLLLGRAGARRLVRPEVIAAKARLGLRAASRRGGTFHLWFHPSNFYHDTEVQLGVLEGVLADAARLRDRGALEVRTMKSYARA